MNPRFKILLSTLLAVFFVLGFALPINPPTGNWYQQFMPNIGSRQITDVFFLDSLSGWAVTNATNQNTDTLFVLKTTNSGDNWAIQYRKIQTGGGFPGYFRIYFVSQNLGYACYTTGFDRTTDGGVSWSSMNAPSNSYQDESILNQSTMWVVSIDGLTGGVFRTTDSGVSWQQQLFLGFQNPDHIYMFNARIGFVCSESGGTRYLRKTTDSGSSWTLINNSEYFHQIYFVDSLTGWKSSVYGFRKTTNGGVTWVTQTLPSGGYIQTNGGFSFSNINKDTIWSTGGYLMYPNNTVHGFLNRTTDGGDTWYYQVPDTTLVTVGGKLIFVDKFSGWSYANVIGGIHTVTGGDTTFILPVRQVSTEIPKNFYLYQSYPNPFNPVCRIKYDIKTKGFTQLIVFDVTGKKLVKLIEYSQSPGTYEVTFDGTGCSSGIYFYSLFEDGKLVDTKKMILIK